MSHTDKEALQLVLDALCTVWTDGPWDLGAGICDNVEGLLIDEDGCDTPGVASWMYHCQKAFEVWDKYSGAVVYPVYDPSAPGTPWRQYLDNYGTGTLWEGVQGELRQDLLDHLIKYFTDRLEEASV